MIVYAPLSGLCVMVNAAAAKEMKQGLVAGPSKNFPSSDVLHRLIRDLGKTHPPFPEKKPGSIYPDFLGIIPTRGCNGACVYCDFSPETEGEGKMSLKMAADVAEWYVGLVDKGTDRTARIHFFGGEPMIAKDVLEVVLHKTRMRTYEKGISPHFEITTNGQYHERDAYFAGTYFNKVVLSLDGPEGIQNLQRPLRNKQNSFSAPFRTAEILSRSQAELCLRACISDATVNSMEDIARWFCETLSPAEITFEALTKNQKAVFGKLLPPDPYGFARNFIRARKICRTAGIRLVYASDITDAPVTSSCPVGRDAVILTPDGRISNCYLRPERWEARGLDFIVGRIYKNGRVQVSAKKLEKLRHPDAGKTRCERCFCRWSCAGGCHVNITYPGASADYDDFCVRTRIISFNSLLSLLEKEEVFDESGSDPEVLHKMVFNPSDLLKDFPG